MAIDYYGRKALRYDDDIMVCAGDVETNGLGGELLMVQWGYMNRVEYATGENMVEEFFRRFLAMPYPAVWFFHFGQYDWRYFLEYIENSNLEVNIGMRTETDIYEIRVRIPGEKDWSVMRDSYALWSHPLEKLAKAFCPELPKLEIDIENFNPENPEHIEYAKRDIEILLKGLPRLFSMIKDHFGINPSATAAGTALKAWQYSLPKNKIYDCQRFDAHELFIRQGYYGGLVFLTSTETHYDCETYDINSSYPANMCEKGVPVGRATYTNDFEEAYPGIYRCRVRTPENLCVAILPARDSRGHMRWYRGEFETVVTTQELQFAAKHGYEILEIYEGLFWEKIEYPFNDMVDLCKEIRSKFKHQTEEMLAKLIQNSLYGKFGTRRERTQLLHHTEIDDEPEGIMPFDPDGLWYVAKEIDETMRCMPHWAVFITANARLKLLNAVYSIGPENCLYGDTDSITVKKGYGHLIDVGDEYGQWKLEKNWQVFRAIAPKVYAGILDDGTYKGAAKGLPRKGITEKHWSELLEYGHTKATTLSLPSLKVAMKKGISEAVQLERKSSNLANSSNFVALENGTVRLKVQNE